MGVIIKNDDKLVPTFLSTIEKQTYNKKLIAMQINMCGDSAQTKEKIKKWVAENKPKYLRLDYVDSNPTSEPLAANSQERFKKFGEIKNDYLAKTNKLSCNYCAIIESDAFLADHTLKTLVALDKPILAPMLMPIPEANDPYRNFFAAVTDTGYYKDDPSYGPIAERKKIGTFKVPLVNRVYLIKAEHTPQLSFLGNGNQWEFIAFSNDARKKNIDQYITNEKEFGSLLHFFKTPTEQEMKNFTFVFDNAKSKK